MEEEKFFMNEGSRVPPTWNSSNYGMKIQTNGVNCSSEQLPNCYFNPNWENSMDQTDPFGSALSSIVSSPATSNAGIPMDGGENIVLRELIGRLGSICTSDEISTHSYINIMGGGGNSNNNNTNSTNTSCYTTPLNSPPRLNLSMMRGNFPIPRIQLPTHPSLVPSSTDPGFSQRAARSSCFGTKSFGGRNGQLGLNESEMGVQENRDGFLQDGICASDKKFSRSSTPENAEFCDSVEEIPLTGGDIDIKGQSDGNVRKRKTNPRGNPKEIPSSPSSKDVKVAAENDKSNAKRSKPDDDANGDEKDDMKAKAEPPKDYIHVRARRGQATDSHSLAERVRREKIGERMKFLQDLVPGCNKVTGKAVMLDEIINYVQSLQHQVEFLSMKLSTVNPRTDFNLEALVSKDVFHSRGSVPQNIYPIDGSVHAFPCAYQSQQGPNLHGDIPNGTGIPFSMNHLNAAIRRNQGMQLHPIDGFGEAASRAPTFWGDDLQTVVQMGFGQNLPQSFHGPKATSQTKVEDRITTDLHC